MSRQNTSDENPILAAWQQQLERARANPFLLQLLLKQYQRILKRLAYFYAQLASLPRRNRRALQRALATSLIGAAMLLALSSAPVVHANAITVSGACTLDEAITNANDDAATFPDCAAGGGADTIYLTGNVTIGVDTPAAALPDITSEITLEGGNFYVSGNNLYRVFNVSSTGDFTINDTTVKDGYSGGNGGGILNDGVVELNNSTVSGSAAARGGGIYNGTGGTLELNDSTVSGNTATGKGGGIFNDGTLELNNSTVSGSIADGNGGGIFNDNDRVVTLNNSTVSGNRADQEGGGIYNDADGVVTLNHSTVNGNSAGEGGGIYNQEDGTVTLNNSTVSGNSAGSDGGGIFTYYGTVTLNNSTVSGNNAGDDGGGMYSYEATVNLNRSLVSGNTSGDEDANEIYNDGSTINADNYNLFGNSEESNGDAFDGFTPGASDFNATIDGGGGTHVPTALASILDATLALNSNPNGTLTHALVTGSPALDKAPNADCTAAPINDIDQRGFPRNVNINGGNPSYLCDIGAFELQLTTAVNVTGLRAIAKDDKNVLKWRTTTETQIAGFNVWRKVENAQHVPNESEGWKMHNAQFIQAKHSGDAQGDKYAFRDKKVKDGNTYRYKIEVKYLDGSSQWTEVVRVEK